MRRGTTFIFGSIKLPTGVRRAHPNEWKSVARILKQLNWQQGDILPKDDWTDKDWVLDWIRNGGAYVATTHGHIAGVLFYEDIKSPKVGYIAGLAVSGSYHGFGIGYKLVEKAARLAAKAKMSKLRVDSLAKYKASKFYQKCGFKKMSRTGRIDGHEYHKFTMKLGRP